MFNKHVAQNLRMADDRSVLVDWLTEVIAVVIIVRVDCGFYWPTDTIIATDNDK